MTQNSQISKFNYRSQQRQDQQQLLLDGDKDDEDADSQDQANDGQGLNSIDSKKIQIQKYKNTKYYLNTGWAICSRTWIGLIQIWGVPGQVGRYCSCLLPKQDVETFQILVNPTQVREQMVHPVFWARFRDASQDKCFGC